MASLLREYLWLWVVLVVLLLSCLISLIFVCLNRWIARQGILMLGLDKKTVSSMYEKYQSPVWNHAPSVKSSTPPLPPRTQFMNEAPVDRSYENLAEEPDYEEPDESNHSYEEDNLRSLPEYLQLESEPGSNVYQEEEGEQDYDDITAEEKKEEEDADYDDVE